MSADAPAATAARGPARWIVPVAAGLTAGVSLFLAWRLNFWVDEAYTLDTTGGGLARAWSQALHFELQAPAYFVLLTLWRAIWGSPFFARVFSTLCVVATIPVAARLARAYLRQLHPVWLVLPLCLHPLLIYSATELRCYALAILLSGLLLLFLHRGYLAEQPSRRARWIYVALSALALYTQYYLGFLLLAGGAAVLVTRRWRLLGSYVVGQLAAGIAFTPILLVLPGQLGGYEEVKQQTGLLLGLTQGYWRAVDYLLPAAGDTLSLVRTWGARLLLLVSAAASIYSWRRLREGRLLVLFALAGVPLLLCVAILGLFGAEMMGPRHTAFLCLPLLLLLLGLWEAVLGRRAAAALACLILALGAASLLVKYRPLAKQGDWIRVAAYIEAHERPGQPILVFKAQSALPLRVHYHGVNRVLPLPREPRFSGWSPSDDVLESEAPLRRAIRAAKSAAGRFWLVTDTGREYLGINYHHDRLERFVRRRFVVERSRGFYRSGVRLLRLREPALSRGAAP